MTRVSLIEIVLTTTLRDAKVDEIPEVVELGAF